LCVYRGSPLPVVDVGLLLGQEAIDAGRLVVIRTGGRTVALAVGSVLGVCVLPAESAQAMPPLLREAANDAVSAIGIMDAELLLFLGAARIMPEALLDRLTAAATAP
jgi:chemotaxis signal transduction protein